MTNERPGFISQDRIRERVYNPGRCVGYEQISLTSTSQGLDISVCSQPPRYAICTLETDATGIGARYFMLPDADPSSGFGMPLYSGSTFDILSTEDMNKFRIIEESANNGQLNILYYV